MAFLLSFLSGVWVKLPELGFDLLDFFTYLFVYFEIGSHHVALANLELVAM